MKKIAILGSIILIIILSGYSFVEARAGGGGSSSGGGSVIGVIIAGLIYGIYEIRRRKMIKKAKQDLEDALKEDSSWDIKGLEKVVEKVFFQYQYAWSDKNLSNVQEYMSKNYYTKANKILEGKLHGKKNILMNIRLEKLTLMSVRDIPGRDGDMFAMEVSATMIDYIVNEKTGKFITSTMEKDKNESSKSYQHRAMNEASDFIEYYIFIRYNGKWLLNNIKQKFSIVGDIIKLSEKDLRKVLDQEQKSDEVNDDMLYND